MHTHHYFILTGANRREPHRATRSIAFEARMRDVTRETLVQDGNMIFDASGCAMVFEFILSQRDHYFHHQVSLLVLSASKHFKRVRHLFKREAVRDEFLDILEFA